MNESLPNKKRKIFIIGDRKCIGYAAEISSCLGKDIGLKLETPIAKESAQTN
jgi:hypothetical protein